MPEFKLNWSNAVHVIGARTVHETALHLLRVLELLHEARVFPYAGNVEGLHLSAYSEDEVVIGYRGRGH